MATYFQYGEKEIVHLRIDREFPTIQTINLI